jgi:hypothetical protein
MPPAPGIVTSGVGPPNAAVEVQPGMLVQPVVLVDENGQYVTTSGSTATAGYLADASGSVAVFAAPAPIAGQVLTATSGSTATWQSGSAETAGYLATTGASVFVAGAAPPTANQVLTATSGTAAAWEFGAGGVLTTLGDMLYENATPALARLAGNTTTVKKFLTQTGNGTISAAPGWNVITTGDVPAVLSQAGQALLNLGYVGATANLLQAFTSGPGASEWIAGSTYLFRIDAIPGATVNGYVTVPWIHSASLANCYIGIYNSGGTQLGVTTELSAVWTNSTTHRIACTGFTAVPANGLLYVAYVNGTSGVGAGPYYVQNSPSQLGWGTASLPPAAAAPWYAAVLAGTATSLPATITIANFSTVTGAYAAIAVD